MNFRVFAGHELSGKYQKVYVDTSEMASSKNNGIEHGLISDQDKENILKKNAERLFCCTV